MLARIGGMVLAIASIFIVSETRAADDEPGEIGSDTLYHPGQCEDTINDYIREWPTVGCMNPAYDYIMNPEARCSEDIKRKAQELRARCAPAKSAKNPSPADCTTPAAPKPNRTSPSYVCFKAVNTNPDPKCQFGFTYRRSDTANPISGGTLAAGGVQEICVSRAGVDLAFEKWTRVAGSGR